ncbi:hypothetical protein HPL003_23765 [Paenibacillus terrae HPL-003]|uniref:Uncharacterized protein n=1 Tax=Paenibacillus terrae (strain HPL-003) TaxID=985665 RepID=G7VSA1_PAETH|nr:hypothetical protein HPL003_23765 [Paenibacillus terrae HPL-003]
MQLSLYPLMTQRSFFKKTNAGTDPTEPLYAGQGDFWNS